MPRALILYAHPCDDSFAAALHGLVCDTLAARGWQVDDCDLYTERFDPVMTATERRAYHDIGANLRPVADYVQRLRNADALIIVAPVWNYGFPAILKGFFDRVFLPGVSFRMIGGQTWPALTHISRLCAVTTYGGSRLRAVWAGDPPRKLVTRVLRRTTSPARMRYLALYDMNRASPARREAFLDKVRKEMEMI
ncbi:flavodoxin family protein [Sinirhodobacter populi]|uniref:Flavodoxin family protein n=1 Tax=Paenirhodobacter populi TaxID=2306993 RepID=A0A443K4V1_9RHOB|nr:NAD(P)H-dependent oxidoreductase [Sinirhodobacter populi]RWR27780.1 flavodoxin family protein [Sinirhodobacter populi]